MAILAQLDESTATAGRPREPRRKLRLEAQGALPSGAAPRIVVHDISLTGLLIESPVAISIDERLSIELPQAGDTWAKVIWASGRFFGCQFDAPVSAGVLSAVQLGSVAAEQEAPASRVEPALDATFGARLLRLRKARGLSQSQVAARLSVSKPTVWAWEQGKARPVESRIAALAEVLGVERSELMSGTGAPDVSALIARSRSQIAAAVGTQPDKVRIWVEL
jgi:transcriptional regulator with XRE-family HTH domain